MAGKSDKAEHHICDLSLRPHLVSSLPSLRWFIPHADIVPRILQDAGHEFMDSHSVEHSPGTSGTASSEAGCEQEWEHHCVQVSSPTSQASAQ